MNISGKECGQFGREHHFTLLLFRIVVMLRRKGGESVRKELVDGNRLFVRDGECYVKVTITR